MTEMMIAVIMEALVKMTKVITVMMMINRRNSMERKENVTLPRN